MTPSGPSGTARVTAEDGAAARVPLDTTIATLLSLANLRGGFDAGQSDEFLALVDGVGRTLGLGADGLRDLRFAARLHDIGMVGVPDRILQKPGRLDEVEWGMLRRHAVFGAEVLEAIPGFARVASTVRHHHERWDGRGYPDGLSGSDIPLSARVIAGCVAFGAMISDRPYRPAYDRATAVEVLRAGSGTQFDPEVVAALVEEVSELPPPSEGSGASDPMARAIKPERGTSHQPPHSRLTQAFDRLESLPALAESQQRLTQLGSDDFASIDAATSIVEADVALTIAVLRATNDQRSGSQPARGVPAAVRSLGTEAVKEIARALATIGVFQRVPGWPITMEQFRLHALATQRMAEQVARALGRDDVDALLAAALVHDIGKLVLATAYANYPHGVHGAAATPGDRLIAERREVGVDHAVAGGVMARRWNLPAPLPAVIEHHHDAADDGEAAVIRLADTLAHHLHGAAINPRELESLAAGLGLEPAELRSLMHDVGQGKRPRRTAQPSPLSKKETAVLAGLSEGKVYKQIALDLGLATSTVRSHCHNAYVKLGVGDRTQAVLMATRKGWI